MIEVKEFKTTDERANHMFQYRVVKIMNEIDWLILNDMSKRQLYQCVEHLNI